MRLSLLSALLLGLCVSACAPADTSRVETVETGTFRYPGDHVDRPVELPEYWWPDRRMRHPEATYTFSLHLDRAPDELWSVFLPRLSMNAAVWVNGHFIGDGGRLEPPLSRNANRPLYFPIPTGMLHAGDNVIRLRLVVEPTFPGLLDPFLVGPAAVLRPTFENRYRFQVVALQGVAVTSIAIAVLIFAVFARRDEQGANAWFATALLLWAVVLAVGFVRDPPVSGRAWEFLGPAAQAGLVYCLIRAFHLRIFGHRLAARERSALVVFGVPGIATALAPTQYAFTAWIAWQVITGSAVVYVMILIFHTMKRGLITHPKTLAVAALLGTVFVVHDLGSVFYGKPISGFWLSAYAASVALLFSGWTILASLADSLTEAETLNRELEGRVRQKHHELESNYRKLRSLERERAIAAERERIMQDVHDGIGGQLVSTLALVESGRGEPDAVADSLHEALDDLRLIIDSLDPDEGDLAAVLGTMRLRVQPRLERGGIAIDWRVRDVPPIEGFGPEQALQVLRVVQESIANVLKHANATRVRIRTGTVPGPGGDEAYVEVCDDGSGMSEEAPPGRGLANMRRRAENLGGALDVESTTEGTRIRLRMPLRVGAATAP